MRFTALAVMADALIRGDEGRHVSKSQFYALVRSGELPAIKLGGRGVWRVDWHQLEAYIERLLKETQEWAMLAERDLAWGLVAIVSRRHPATRRRTATPASVRRA